MSFQYLVNRPSINWLKDVPQDDMFAERERNSSTGEKTSRSSCAANIKQERVVVQMIDDCIVLPLVTLSLGFCLVSCLS
jgi:hypothetical protein